MRPRDRNVSDVTSAHAFQMRHAPSMVSRHSRDSKHTTIIRAVAIGMSFAIALYLIHHQLQIVYFKTCKANLLTVVLHHRSDVCYALNMAISGIERCYQQGIAALMQWGMSAAAVMLPYMFSSSQGSVESARNKTQGHQKGNSTTLKTDRVNGRVCHRQWWLPSWATASSPLPSKVHSPSPSSGPCP